MIKMTKEDWARVRFFSPQERWGDPYMVARQLVFRMDALRRFVNRPIVIHCAYEDRPKGFHPLGMAADFHIRGMGLLDQFIAATRFFSGIGVYPYWNTPGIHGDIRPITEISKPEARWWRDEDGKYLSLTSEAFSRNTGSLIEPRSPIQL